MTIPYAQHVRIALVSSPSSVLHPSFDAQLSTYFRTPRILSRGQIFAVPARRKDLRSFCFRCRAKTSGSGTNSLGELGVQAEDGEEDEEAEEMQRVSYTDAELALAQEYGIDSAKPCAVGTVAVNANEQAVPLIFFQVAELLPSSVKYAVVDPALTTLVQHGRGKFLHFFPRLHVLMFVYVYFFFLLLRQ